MPIQQQEPANAGTKEDKFKQQYDKKFKGYDKKIKDLKKELKGYRQASEQKKETE